MKRPEAPRHLSADGKRMWARLFDDFDLDDAGGQSLLQAACEAFDRAQQARKLIKASGGPLLKDRFGQYKPNPACAIERDARGQMIAAIRAMKLDVET
jgi:P27 family predicted phage terminase small subunit